ncbi:MAG: extracellular solute-binding protein [Thermomicrobiales bacterium]|nr:extracellular solute-binding protein [Thermomicrobiales bacterium]MCO5225912.1 extracellular solute-binding protein [Thermomicrobiales bacterium]MCO5226062.1 extracellular solute-binding protein [Thermomicrobiales bacterium]
MMDDLFKKALDRRTALKLGAASAAAIGAAKSLGVSAQEGGFNVADLEISGDVEIEYWQYEFASKTALVNELIPEFEAANPGIKVKHVNFPYDDFRQQVAAAVQAGEGPDVLNVFFGWIPAYVQQQFLQPLNQEWFPHDVIESEFFPTVAAAKVKDDYYALPTAVRTLALFCNMDLLDAAGKEPPTTWEELVDVAVATTVKDGNNFDVVGFTWDIGGQGHSWWREGLVRQNGGLPMSDDNRTVDFTSPEAVEAFKYHVAFLMEHGVTQSGFQTDGQTAFGSGKAALHVDGSFRVSTYASNAPDLNYKIVPLPANKEQASFASFWCNTITRNAAEGDKAIAAAKWVDFLASAEVMQRWTPAVGELPARTALAEDPELLANDKVAPFIESLPFSYATFMVNEADLRQFVMDAYDNVTLAGVDPEVALQEAQEKVQAQMDEYWASFDE